MLRTPFARIPSAEGLLLGFLLFSVLWRGGKSLEATWMLVGVASALIVADAIRGSGKIENGKLKIENYPNVLWIPAVSFFAWTILSYFFSTTKNYGLDEVLRDGALVLIFLWTMRHARGEAGAVLSHRFVQTMVLAAVLASLFGVLVYVLQPVNRFVGTFFDYRFHTDYWPNAWAQFLLLAWPLVFLWMRGKQGKLRVAGCGLLGFLFGALLLSYSRGALIAFAGQLVLLALVWAGKKWGEGAFFIPHRREIIPIGLIAVIAVAVFFTANTARSGFHPVQSVGEKITFTADEGGSSVDERKLFWGQALALTLDRPLFGWGPYSFRFVQQRLQTGVLQTSDHPHNVFLKLAAERGVIASLLFIVLLVLVSLPQYRLLYCCIARKRITRFEQSDQQCSNPAMQRFLFFLSVTGVLAHNLIDYNLQFVGIALPFWMMLGILASETSSKIQSRGKILSKKLVHKIELVIAVLLLAVALREGVFLVISSLGRHAEVAGEHEAALWWYNRSSAEWFSRDMHVSRALLATLSNRTGTAHEAIDTFLTGNTEDPRGWRLQGDIARTEGDIPAALEAYGKAYERGRWNDLSITLALAETLIESDRGSELVEKKAEIDALLGFFVEAIVQNAHFVALSHNAEDAIALSTLLAEVFPDSAPRYEVLAAKADFAMRSERSKVKSRPSGYLW
ncbi:MAG: O-antigen ligase family protein [Patescibacteria group bacterium]